MTCPFAATCVVFTEIRPCNRFNRLLDGCWPRYSLMTRCQMSISNLMLLKPTRTDVPKYSAFKKNTSLRIELSKRVARIKVVWEFSLNWILPDTWQSMVSNGLERFGNGLVTLLQGTSHGKNALRRHLTSLVVWQQWPLPSRRSSELCSSSPVVDAVMSQPCQQPDFYLKRLWLT